MKPIIIAFCTLAVSATFFVACSNDNEPEIAPKSQETVNPPSTVPGVETTPGTNIEVSLKNEIRPIFNKYSCSSCHSASQRSGGVNLETYTSLKSVATNGALYGAMSHTGSYSPMPSSNTKATSAELNLVKKWIDEGAKDN